MVRALHPDSLKFPEWTLGCVILHNDYETVWKLIEAIEKWNGWEVNYKTWDAARSGHYVRVYIPEGEAWKTW